MGGRSNDLQPLLFWLHYLLGRNVPFRGLAFLTLEKGVWGLPVFLWLLFPQGVIYGITWQSLQAGPEDGNTVFIWQLFFLLLLFTAAGALLEGIFHHP